MLVLSRKQGEVIRIGDDVQVQVLRVRGRVSLGITAPEGVRIVRAELQTVTPAAPIVIATSDPIGVGHV